MPPTFLPSTIAVYENASTTAAVGTPLQAPHPTPSVTVEYFITGGSGLGVFKVGACDGQVRLIAGGTLNYDYVQQYTLIVSAVPDLTWVSATNVTVTVNVRSWCACVCVLQLCVCLSLTD